MGEVREAGEVREMRELREVSVLGTEFLVIEVFGNRDWSKHSSKHATHESEQ